MKTALLTTNTNLISVRHDYIKGFNLDESTIDIVSLYRNTNLKKTPMKEIKAYIENTLLSVIKDYDIMLVTDGEYFKALTGKATVEKFLGTPCKCRYTDKTVLFLPNNKSMFYDPSNVKAKISIGIDAYKQLLNGSFTAKQDVIIHDGSYPNSLQEIKDKLDYILSLDQLITIDIETFSLKHFDAGIGTIAFSWSKHSGTSFLVDYKPYSVQQENGDYGYQETNHSVRSLLKDFFIKSKGKKHFYHNGAFDIKVLIYQLFMDHILDQEGLLTGMKVMLDDIDWGCTKLITYLATNTTAGNELGLKKQAMSFAGNYSDSVDDAIKDIRKIDPSILLKYNLIDTLSTYYVYDKNYPIMVQDDQLDVYNNIFKPSQVTLIHTELTGIPMDMKRVNEVDMELSTISQDVFNILVTNKYVKQAVNIVIANKVDKYNKTHKKQKTAADFSDITFNPNSDSQLGVLFYEVLNLPVIDVTANKNPSVGSKVMKKFINISIDQETIDLLNTLIEYKAVAIMLSTFMPAFNQAVKGDDGWYYLFGSFNLGGTVSGRLSSSQP